MKPKQRYIPALHWTVLTHFYDPLLRWGMQEDHFKLCLVRQANIQPGQHVLDLGCGTATLTIMLKQAHPDAFVIGLDGDPPVLTIGQEKVDRAGVDLALDCGMAYAQA